MAKQYSEKESDMEVMEEFCERQRDEEYYKITMDDIKKIEPEKIECFANMLRGGVPEQYVIMPIKNARYFDEDQIFMFSHAAIAWADGKARDNTAFLCMQNPNLDAFMMFRADMDARNNVPPEEIRKYLEEASKTEDYFKQKEIREECILRLSEKYPRELTMGKNHKPIKNKKMSEYLAKESSQIYKERAAHAAINRERSHPEEQKEDIYNDLKAACREEKPEAEKERQYAEDAIFNNADTSGLHGVQDFGALYTKKFFEGHGIER